MAGWVDVQPELKGGNLVRGPSGGSRWSAWTQRRPYFSP